ncbi:hypothetical protein J6590_063208 [Homalodisca vitripennis]|nr:hypothetical protein J6590_063208 [Homalodisca vitripennis]
MWYFLPTMMGGSRDKSKCTPPPQVVIPGFKVTGTTLAGSGLGHKWCTKSSSTWPSYDHSPQRGLHTPNSFFHSQLRHTQQCRFNYQVYEFSDWHNTSWLRSRPQVVHYTEFLNMAFMRSFSSTWPSYTK